MSKGPLDAHDDEVFTSILDVDNHVYSSLGISSDVNSYLNASLFYPSKDLLWVVEMGISNAVDIILDANDPML